MQMRTTPGPTPSATDLVDAALALSAPEDLPATLQAALDLVARWVPDADWASVSLRAARGRISTAASSHPVAARADELQARAGAGPCLQAANGQDVVQVDDVATDRSFTAWSTLVTQDGRVRAVASLSLSTPAGTLGSINLYAGRPSAFGAPDLATARVAAGVISLAVRAAQREEQLREGMAGRTVIGQAQGIFMERFKATPDQAFALLSRLSQDTNTRLGEVARAVTETGTFTAQRRAAG